MEQLVHLVGFSDGMIGVGSNDNLNQQEYQTYDNHKKYS